MQRVFKRNGGMKQTAVDYLHERYMYVTWLRNRDEISINKADDLRKMYFELAKRIEKEQIVEAYILGEHQQGFIDEAQQYYNQNYQKK
jgi:hypothetical protein